MKTNQYSDLPYRPCVGVMLINEAGLIFTGERIDTPGAWQMPQGGIDKGETPDVAALRELEEEIGVAPVQVNVLARTHDWLVYDLPDHLLGKAWGGRYRGQKQLWYKMQLTAGDDAVNITTKHPEFGRWKWSTPTEVVDEIVDFKKDIYSQVIVQLT